MHTIYDVYMLKYLSAILLGWNIRVYHGTDLPPIDSIVEIYMRRQVSRLPNVLLSLSC